MAHFAYSLTVSKNTTAATLETLIMTLTYGIITHVEIIIPDGQKACTHLRIKYHEFQLYPLSRGYWYEGDGVVIPFDDMFPLITPPYELKAEGYNTSEDYDHAIYMHFTVQRPEELGYSEIPAFVMQKLYALIGKEYEVT